MKERYRIKHCLKNFILIIALSGYFISASAFDTTTIQITEFMAVNSSILADEDGDSTDWIELYNPAATAINLDGWYISDEADMPFKWRFPNVTIEAGEYLVIFASSKDRNDPSKNLHTNFKLSSAGENLILTKSNLQDVAFAFPGLFPTQFKDISYGILGDHFEYFNIPTPGAANVAGTFLPPPEFSFERGFYSSPFNLVLSSIIDGSTIKYTTDGSHPTPDNALEYTSTIPINSTTPVRAVLYKQGYDTSVVVTHTYLFLDSIYTQSNYPEGYPADWGRYTAIPGIAYADYAMDPDVCLSAEYADAMDSAMFSIPTISIVTDIGNFFSHDSSETTGGIYVYTGPPLDNIPQVSGYGKGWERPASVEYIFPDGSEGFQVNCGLRIHGGHSRRPEKDPKHSFRLCFRTKYGTGKLNYDIFDDDNSATEKFNTLVLRGGFNNSWLHSSYIQRTDAQYIQDTWMKDAHAAMGWHAARQKFVHLYLNGLYWGLYNISEKPDGDFMETYLDGDADDYDIMKDFAYVFSGTGDIWDTLIATAKSGLADNAVYQRLQGNNPDGTPNPEYEPWVDITGLIDYMLVNFYGGNDDWDRHNWVSARNRVNPGMGFQFFIWDAEHNLKNVNINNLSVFDTETGKCPSNIFQPLRKNEEFLLLFADRVHKHLFNDGVLTPSRATEIYMKRVEEIEMAIIGESTRWGDYRGSLMTKTNWESKKNYLLDTFFPQRTEILLSQLRNDSLYPLVDAPEFSQHGGIVDTNYALTITANSGNIYYTMDGGDPRLLGGEISSHAVLYSSEIIMDSNYTVKARAKDDDVWSALTEADFILGIPPVSIEPALLTVGIDKHMNYPNPFSLYTTISYYLLKESKVDISIYSIDGRIMANVFNGYQNEGINNVIWQPQGLGNGIYIYKISTSQYVATGKMLFGK